MRRKMLAAGIGVSVLVLTALSSAQTGDVQAQNRSNQGQHGESRYVRPAGAPTPVSGLRWRQPAMAPVTPVPLATRGAEATGEPAGRSSAQATRRR